MKNCRQETFKICFVGIMLALATVLSVFCQIRLFGDIRLDLSYLTIVVICYAYGALTGCMYAGFIAMFNSTFFSAYGVSVSWISANLIIGLICGLVLHYVRFNKKWLKTVVDVGTIIVSCAIGLLVVKTVIECKLYEIPFGIKVVKNAVAFASDTIMMIVGYFALIPLYNRIIRKKEKNYE